jgi:hypothetical protein
MLRYEGVVRATDRGTRLLDYCALLYIMSLSQHSLFRILILAYFIGAPLFDYHIPNYFFIFYKIKFGKTFFTKISHFNAYFVGL